MSRRDNNNEEDDISRRCSCRLRDARRLSLEHREDILRRTEEYHQRAAVRSMANNMNTRRLRSDSSRQHYPGIQIIREARPRLGIELAAPFLTIHESEESTSEEAFSEEPGPEVVSEEPEVVIISDRLTSTRSNEPEVIALTDINYEKTTLGSGLCPICLDHLSAIRIRGETLMSTLCGHVYCKSCIDNYFHDKSDRKRHPCPKCRNGIKKQDVHPLYF
ncbi:hypothetical protein ACOME3_008942 [Neoechinorhynchus agilis]